MADKKRPFYDHELDLLRTLTTPIQCELCGEMTCGSSNGPLCNCIWKICPWCRERFKARSYMDNHDCEAAMLIKKASAEMDVETRIASTTLADEGIDLKSFPPIKKSLVDYATETPKHEEASRLKFPSTGDADLDKMIGDVITTIGTKGQEYTIGDSDRLKNFKRAAEKISRRKNRQPMDMVDVWQIFFDKHMSAVEAYIANGFEVQSNEPISGRIMDCIVYLMLFYKMTVEIEEKKLNAHKADHGLPA